MDREIADLDECAGAQSCRLLDRLAVDPGSIATLEILDEHPAFRLEGHAAVATRDCWIVQNQVTLLASTDHDRAWFERLAPRLRAVDHELRGHARERISADGRGRPWKRWFGGLEKARELSLRGAFCAVEGRRSNPIAAAPDAGVTT